jgi:hypothetical protein
VRLQIVRAMIDRRHEDPNGDLRSWKWLKNLIETLGVDGMSSDESDVENEQPVFRVKVLPWRRDVQQYWKIIDGCRFTDSGIFSPRGSKGVQRIRGVWGPSSTRDPAKGLPRSFYDDSWFGQKDDSYRRLTLNFSNDPFEWLGMVSRPKSR